MNLDKIPEKTRKALSKLILVSGIFYFIAGGIIAVHPDTKGSMILIATATILTMVGIASFIGSRKIYKESKDK